MTPPVCTEPLPLLDLPVADEPQRGLGRLVLAVQDRKISLPLRKVDLSARVADRVAEVTMEQTFRNTYTEHLEAVYVFPLPGGAAVSRFELRVGDRVIEGRVQERGEARRQYREAISQGRRAALLEEERNDVFTVQIGNLPPGEEIRIRLVYSERLPFFEDGSTEIRLPLVVAPRYIPGTAVDRAAVGEGIEPDTDIVPDASRITPPRLAPGFNPEVDLKVAVDLVTAGSSGLADMRCSQHSTRLQMESGQVRVELARVDERLNRDFVLRWRLAGQAVKPHLLLHRDQEGRQYGLLSLVPPAREGFLGTARDVIFVLDRSGSMEGVKMTSAARACAVLMETLGPRDRFAIQAFDDCYEWFEPNGPRGSRFLQADEAGLERGQRYLREVEARGGTELDGAMREALKVVDSRETATGRVPVVVLLTDGQIGDESRVLKRLQKELGDTRVFTVGIDTAVNEAFLSRLAAVGGGTATFVTPGSAVEEALQDVGREIGTPLVVNMHLVDDGCGIEADSQAPARIPDLFAGRASAVFFRGRTAGRVRVQGTCMDGQPYDEVVDGEMVDLPALAQLWARARVTDLEDRFRIQQGDPAAIRSQIIDLAVRHSLLTRFTAFVVVDQAEVVNAGGQTRTVMQPVEMPEAWDMEMGMGTAHASLGGRAMQACYAPMQNPQCGAPMEMEAMMDADDVSCSPPEFEARMMDPMPMSPMPSPRAMPCAAPPASCTAPPPPPPAYGAPVGSAFGPVNALASPMKPSFLSPPSPPAPMYAEDEKCKKEAAPPSGMLARAKQAVAGITGGGGARFGKSKVNPVAKPQAATPRLSEAKDASRDAAADGTVRQERAATVPDPVLLVLDDLERVLREALQALQAGRVPDAGVVEQARKALLQALAHSDKGANAPAMQRFLRSAAVDLVAALGTPDVTAASLVPLFERHLQAFTAARTEADAAWGTSPAAGAPEAPFWEGSV